MTTTLTKADLADRLFEKGEVENLTKLNSKNVVDFLFEEIRSALERGESIKISGFGNFELRDKSGRPGRNPKTGEEKVISPRRVVTFKAGQKLKAQVQAYEGEASS